MTIEDQIKDEKLQYNINTEAAKISALSSSKIEKQTKTIADQREKQIKAIQDKRPNKSIEKFTKWH